MMQNEEKLKIKRRYEDYLLKLQGVTGVGLNGSIIIYVERLTPQLAAMLPRTLEGVPIRIIETGKIVPLIEAVPVAHAIYANRTGRFRPAPGGISCGHPVITAGTLSCRAIEKRTKRILGLSNNHIVALDWGDRRIGKKGDSTLQPAPYDGGSDPADKIGELERWIRVELPPVKNLIDAAAFKEIPSDVLRKDILEIGVPESSVKPEVGMKVVKSGRTSGITYGTIIDVNATVNVSGWGVCTFVDQIMVQPAFGRPGDSGSWTGTVDTWRSVGLLYAGSPYVTVLCKALNIERLLDLTIIPPLPTIPAALLLGAYGMVLGTVQLGLSLKKPKEVAV